MPYIEIVTSAAEVDKAATSAAVAKVVAEGLGKTTDRALVEIRIAESLYFRDSMDPCAMVRIDSVGGMLHSVMAPLSKCLEEHLKVDSARILVAFRCAEADAFGKSGKTLEELFNETK
mmetsp:Transcript_21008/g.37207  ORF Transcript_21008/g.37207 Transcript_21008/m.37207 type:complete len:118 (+) Transcript_21008:91-444(+)